MSVFEEGGVYVCMWVCWGEGFSLNVIIHRVMTSSEISVFIKNDL